MKSKTSVVRRWLVIGCIGNICATVLIPLVLGVGIGISRTAIVSRFRDLHRAGVINAEKLKEFDGGRYSTSWTELPDDLTHGLRDFETVAWFIAAFTAATAVLLYFCSVALPSDEPA